MLTIFEAPGQGPSITVGVNVGPILHCSDQRCHFSISDSQEFNGLGIILKSGDEQGLRSGCTCLSAMASVLKRSMNLNEHSMFCVSVFLSVKRG